MEYVDEPTLIKPEELDVDINMKSEKELQDSPPKQQEPKPKKESHAGASDHRILVGVEDPDIIYPHYGNDARTKIVGFLRWPDQPPSAPLTRMEGEKGTQNKFVHDVFRQYTEEDLQANTKRELTLLDMRRKLKAEHDDNRRVSETRAKLFKFKTEILDTEEVANAPNDQISKNLKRKIRKATSESAISAYVAALILHVENLNNGESN